MTSRASDIDRQTWPTMVTWHLEVGSSCILLIKRYRIQTTIYFPGTAAEIANNSRKVNTAIGVSVACTFLFCLIVGCLLAAFFIHKQKNRVHFSANERSNDYKREQNESPATNDTELQSIQQYSNIHSLSSKCDIRKDTLETVPKIQVQRTSTPGAPFVVNTWCDGMIEDESGLQCPKSEDQAKPRRGSCVSVRSWFPQQDVQYGI